jgi:hypothetical protein
MHVAGLVARNELVEILPLDRLLLKREMLIGAKIIAQSLSNACSGSEARLARWAALVLPRATGAILRGCRQNRKFYERTEAREGKEAHPLLERLVILLHLFATPKAGCG